MGGCHLRCCGGLCCWVGLWVLFFGNICSLAWGGLRLIKRVCQLYLFIGWFVGLGVVYMCKVSQNRTSLISECELIRRAFVFLGVE